MKGEVEDNASVCFLENIVLEICIFFLYLLTEFCFF